jgi:hypothetical protein
MPTQSDIGRTSSCRFSRSERSGLAARYHNAFHRHDGVWRIRHRRIHPIFDAADSIAILTAADARFLDAATGLVASGIKVFETYERDVLARGAEGLLDGLRAFPKVMRDHLEAIGQVPDTQGRSVSV